MPPRARWNESWIDENGDEVPAIKEAMEQSMAPGSQTFEQDLYRLYKNEVITLEEALANADSPTNLSWLINNSEIGASNPGNGTTNGSSSGGSSSKGNAQAGEGASFTEFTLNMSAD